MGISSIACATVYLSEFRRYLAARISSRKRIPADQTAACAGRRSRGLIGEEEIVPPLSPNWPEILVERQGQVVSRREIIEKIWGEENAIEVSEQALDALVRRLRDRLATLDSRANFITTVRGHGLRLDNPPFS
jgi:DNA-binding response OmpR family regulator